MYLPPLRQNTSPSYLPKGECRFLLQEPDIGNPTTQKCACQEFVSNETHTSSVCQCGHQAWHHVLEAEPLPVSREEYNKLVHRLRYLEEAYGELKIRKDQEQEDMSRIIRRLHDDLTMTSTQTDNRFLGQEGRLSGVMDRVCELQEFSKAMQKKVIDLDDSSSKIEAKVDSIECDARASKQRAKEVTSSRSRPAHRASSRNEWRVQPWSCHILFVPNRVVPEPLNVSSITHRRCCSRGLLRLLTFDGPDEASFVSAVNMSFSFIIKNRRWAPFIIMLSSLGGSQPSWNLTPIAGKERTNEWNRAFLERNCAQKGRPGETPTIVIGLSDEELTWKDIRALPAAQGEDEWLWHDSAEFRSEPRRHSRVSKRSDSMASTHEGYSTGCPSPKASSCDSRFEDCLITKRQRTSSDEKGQHYDRRMK